MQYGISRNGQNYGPYTLDDLRRYLASGNVLPTDMVKAEDSTEWMTVSQLLGTVDPPASTEPPQAPYNAPYANPGYTSAVYGSEPYSSGPNASIPAASNLADSSYPDPPNLHWGLVLLFGFLTGTLFMYVWNPIVAAWLKRVQPNATSIFFYLGWVVLAFIQFGFAIPNAIHTVFHPGVHVSYNPVGGILGLIVWIVKLIARFSQRTSLEEHYNTVEPVGLRLSPVMTFFFGGIYFQWHLNRIQEMKQAARYNMAVRGV